MLIFACPTILCNETFYDGYNGIISPTGSHSVVHIYFRLNIANNKLNNDVPTMIEYLMAKHHGNQMFQPPTVYKDNKDALMRINKNKHLLKHAGYKDFQLLIIIRQKMLRKNLSRASHESGHWP